MERSAKYKLCLTTAALAVGCTVSYIIYKQRQKRGLRDAAQLFHYLTIETVTSKESCDQVVEELKRQCQKHGALGFDCEWVTQGGKRHPVALVQLSSLDGYCGLFRLNAMNVVPESLKNLLEDETIYKVGVAPFNDAKYLCQDYSVVMQSTLDIRYLAELSGIDPGGLAALSSKLLGATLDKSWRIRCSDWETSELSNRQMKYAAIDAHVAIKIFEILLEKLSNERSLLSRWFGSKGDSVWSYLDEHCRNYADLNYKGKPTGRIKPESPKDNDTLVIKKRCSYATRTKPLYNNCFLEAPDGELLCTCDKNKALWFVKKELADISKEEPLTVRLRFEPAGRSVGETGRYYQLQKENKCVVCGSTNSYIRKNVVPREYRKIFPELMKDHSSHDVLLMCVECHQRSNVLDQAVRERLARMCDAPYVCHRPYTEDNDCRKIKSAARALLNKSFNLPEARREELRRTLLQYYSEYTEVTEDLLKEAADIQVRVENTDYESHGARVVQYFLKYGGLLRLEEVWRTHFLNAMKPRHMPALWSIKHTEERLRIKWNEGRITQEDLKLVGLTRL